MKRIFLHIILIVGAIVFLYPFLWMVTASLSPESEITKLTFLPSTFTLTGYQQMVEKIPIFRAFINSLLVSLSITAGVLVFG